MRNVIRNIRDNLLATDDTVCLQRARLVTEAWKRHEDGPPPLKRAKAFAHVLRNMDLDVESNPIFAGNTSSRPRAWMLMPEHGFGTSAQVLIENDGLEGILDGEIPDDLREYWADRAFGGNCGIGHLAVNMNTVVHDGLQSIIDRARESNERNGDEARREYRRAMIIGLNAVIKWAQRYAEAAERAAETEADPLRRNAHLCVAKACRRVPAEPARNLFEALQAMALIHLAIFIEGHGMSVSIGLPDRVLAPFIDESFDADRATNFIAAFMLKVTANSLFGRGSKTQAITVGGVDYQGRDRCNELTLCFLNAWDMIRVGDPHVFLRWHENMDDGMKQKAAQMLADGRSMPLLIHDVPTARGFQRCGVKREDARDYCVVGCNELGIPGRSMQSGTAMAGTIQYIAMLNEILLNHPQPNAIDSTDELLSLLEDHAHEQFVRRRKDGFAHWRRRGENMPTPFTSALMNGCVERGKDLTFGMDYHIPGLYERQLTNGANALAAIHQLVFEDGQVSMRQLVEAMEGDFAGHDDLRRRILSAPKWGNDDPRADKWALRLVDMRERILDRIDDECGHDCHSVCHVVRSLHHVDGRNIGASPDGRHAWTPVSDSIGAIGGVSDDGPTAILRSVLKLDPAEEYRGGYNLNLTLPPPDATPDVVLNLIQTFFTNGGQELQINSFDLGMLQDAREHPEEYGDLVVRFAGLSARFVDLSEAEQDEIISRAEAMG